MVPGLVYLPDWLDDLGQQQLLADIDAERWSTELRRRVQHYGHRYDYGRRAVAVPDGGSATPIPTWARTLALRLHVEGHTDRPADQVIVNEYLPGQGISAHVDCVPCFGPAVAAVSLGSACVMDFTGPDHADTVPVWLLPGSLCLMTGPARYEWRHAIAARKSDPAPAGRVPRSRRVSVTFRTVLPDPPLRPRSLVRTPAQ
jgi:alkylated DNA repair dioxygenase AlkB